jgi:hypothetical protein
LFVHPTSHRQIKPELSQIFLIACSTEGEAQLQNAEKYQEQSWLNQPTGCQTGK